MASGNGLVKIIGGDSYFGLVTVVDSTLENALGFSHTDMINVSGSGGSVTVAAVNVILIECDAAPASAIDLT